MSILLYSQATLTNLNPIFYLCLIFYTLTMLSHLPWSSADRQRSLCPPQTTNPSPPSLKPHNNAPTSPSLSPPQPPRCANPPAAFTPGLDDDSEPHLAGNAALRAPQNLSAIDIPAADKARRARAARRKATEAKLARPETQALQSAALAYFDAWRDTVLQRVDEVLNSSAASPQPPRARPTSLALALAAPESSPRAHKTRASAPRCRRYTRRSARR